MTLNEKAGITTAEYNSNPPEESWDKWIDVLGGMDAVRPFLPFDLKELFRLYRKDPHFNASPSGAWDRAAGYDTKKIKDSRSKLRAAGPFKDFLIRNGVTCFSNADCVCLLKRCAEKCVLEVLELALPDEIYAVFECAEGIPDRFNRQNVYDYDCKAAFLRKPEAESFEKEDPKRRVMKRVVLKGLLDKSNNAERSDEDET